MRQSSENQRDHRSFSATDQVIYSLKGRCDGSSRLRLDGSMGKLPARVGELQKTQQRISHEMLEWKMQVQLAYETTYSAWILKASAEDEEYSVASDLKALETDIDLLLTSDAAEVLAETWTEILLATTTRLDALRERQVDARLKLQICRRHWELQNRILEQSEAALLRAEQRNRAISEEIATLRCDLGSQRAFTPQS